MQRGGPPRAPARYAALQRDLARHPVAAALNRRPLRDDELQQIAAFYLLALRAVETGTAAEAECLDLVDLLAIGVRLARDGIGAEVLPLAAPLLDELRTATLPGAMVAYTDRLRELHELLVQQRRLATRDEWLRAMQAICRRRFDPRCGAHGARQNRRQFGRGTAGGCADCHPESKQRRGA